MLWILFVSSFSLDKVRSLIEQQLFVAIYGGEISKVVNGPIESRGITASFSHHKSAIFPLKLHNVRTSFFLPDV